jgi:ribosome-binding protein aMBF1 (putative translation factor)
MERIEDFELTPFSEFVDEVYGVKGTPKRDAMEKKLKEEMDSYFLGEAIRNARKKQNLTQEQLGERVGVQRAQISRLESGKGMISLSTMKRVFQALGVATATLDLGIAGKVALW